MSYRVGYIYTRHRYILSNRLVAFLNMMRVRENRQKYRTSNILGIISGSLYSDTNCLYIKKIKNYHYIPVLTLDK